MNAATSIEIFDILLPAPNSLMAEGLLTSVPDFYRGRSAAIKSPSRAFCFPAPSKLPGDNHASYARFSAGHSLSVMENQAVSQSRMIDVDRAAIVIDGQRE